MTPIHKQQQKIERLEKRLEFWRNKLSNTWIAKHRPILNRINDIRTEIEVERSILYRMQDKLRD
jgi:hypothetical protein